MKILLDENLPASLKQDLEDHDVSTVEEQGWRSYKNGELLHRMIAAGFQVLITFDTNLQYQQNFKKHAVPLLFCERVHESLRRFLPSFPILSNFSKGV